MSRHAITLLALLLSGPVLAQDERPAVETPSLRSPAEASGTVIVGDRESPIGLFITPWRESTAQADMDRPARLLEADLLPIDEPVFVRQIEYHRALSGALRSRNQVSPDVPAGRTP